MQFEEIKEFTYHIGWRSNATRPGRHRSNQQGMGMEFRGHTTLLAYPDPRRIDVRQTIKDPLEQVYVRIFNQKSSIPVFALCDLSGSMQYGKQQSKLNIAADVIQSIAQSAAHNGDPVGLIGFDDAIREEWLCTLSPRPHWMIETAEKLRSYIPGQSRQSALSDLVQVLPATRSLIFLVSDFHMPLDTLEASLDLMMMHHIIPVVLWDSSEYKDLPDFGITSVVDPETGEKRTLFLRKSYKDRILETFANRKKAIEDMFLRYDMQPFFIENDFDADALTDYFYQYVAP